MNYSTKETNFIDALTKAIKGRKVKINVSGFGEIDCEILTIVEEPSYTTTTDLEDLKGFEYKVRVRARKPMDEDNKDNYEEHLCKIVGTAKVTNYYPDEKKFDIKIISLTKDGLI